MQRFEIIQCKEGRENIYLEKVGYPRGTFIDDVRLYANGLLNSNGGVLYFGVLKNGSAVGHKINRKDEDDYRLAVDHAFGSFQPFVSSSYYRLSFITLLPHPYKIIELKVSVGDIGEIYENGYEKVYLIDSAMLIGPLYPQELKELILLKYKELIEGAEEAAKYTTPNLAAARHKAKLKTVLPQKKNNCMPVILEESVENPKITVPETIVPKIKVVKINRNLKPLTNYSEDTFFGY